MLDNVFYQFKKTINWWWLILLLLSPVSYAQEVNSVQNKYTDTMVSYEIADLQDLIALSKQRITVLKKELEAYARGEYPPIINRQLLDNISVVLELAEMEILRITLALRDARQQYTLTGVLIDELEEQWLQVGDSARYASERQSQLRLHESQRQWLNQLDRLEANYQEIGRLIQEKLSQLWYRYYLQEKQTRELAYLELIADQQAQLTSIISELEELRYQRRTIAQRDITINAEILILDAKIFLLEEQIKLTRIEQRLNYLAESVNELADFTVATEESAQLREVARREASFFLTALLTLEEAMQENLDLLIRYRELQIHSVAQGILSEAQQNQINENIQILQEQYQIYFFDLVSLENQLATYLEHSAQTLSPALTIRRGLPAFNVAEWTLLGEQIVDVPEIIMDYFVELGWQIQETYQNTSVWKIVLLGSALFLWIVAWVLARYYLTVVINLVKERRQRVTENLIYVFATLVKIDLFGFFILALGLSFFLILGISFKYYAMPFYLVLVWLVFRFIIGGARLLLVERISDVTGQDVRLYRGLKWAFILGGVITAATVMVWQLKVASEVQDIFVRFFMLFLLTVALILLRGYQVLPTLLKPFLAKRRLYIARATSLFAIFVPITLLSVAMIGLVGYIDLAWALSYYQAIFVLVAVGYIIVRGLFIDFMDSASGALIRRVKNGWLWSEAILKPVDKVLRILLLLGAIIILFRLYGWGRDDSLVPEWVSTVLNYSLISFPGGNITLIAIIKLVITVVLFVWAARWIKEFTYRWLFKNIKDPGIRYSLSVFSQYAMVSLGVFITMRVLGIDFTGMAVVFGGLAVGLGFGLRDFANNIVSGVMLLIERPVKEGDIVTVGEFEGEVKHIGIRSMVVTSWDHMEVMVPNSEVFNKIFTNWTHHDDIIRTVVTVKIQRTDNVYRVEQLLFDVIAQQKEILADPKSQVFLKEIGEALLEFEVRYFINVRLSSRFAVRSILLFSIWKKFAEHDIKPPYPKQDVYVKQLKSH